MKIEVIVVDTILIICCETCYKRSSTYNVEMIRWFNTLFALFECTYLFVFAGTVIVVTFHYLNVAHTNNRINVLCSKFCLTNFIVTNKV